MTWEKTRNIHERQFNELNEEIWSKFLFWAYWCLSKNGKLEFCNHDQVTSCIPLEVSNPLDLSDSIRYFFLTASHRARSLPFQPSTHISDHKFSSKIEIHTIKTVFFSFFILTHFCSIFLNHTTAVIFPWHYHAPGLPRQTGSLTWNVETGNLQIGKKNWKSQVKYWHWKSPVRKMKIGNLPL